MSTRQRVSKEIILILSFIVRILYLKTGILILAYLANSTMSLAITMPYEKQKMKSEENYPKDIPHKLSAVFPNVQARVH
ncbi:MAG: hypothetical protein ACE5K2_06805, partial [Candidatus Zixiibacteriota bacterium]